MTLFERLHTQYHEAPEAGGGPAAPDPTPAAPSAAPETPASSTPSTPEPAPSPAGDAPWSQSLAQRFTDETQRAAVDAYLREEIQPYVTQREQELGQVGDVWNNLWDEEQSVGQYLALTEEIYGPEFAQSVAQAFQAAVAGEGGPPAAAGAPEGEPGDDPEAAFEAWLEQQPEPVQEMMRERMAEREDASYDAILAEVGQAEPTIVGADHLFSRYVAVTDGDIPQAVEMWRAEMAPIVKLAHEQAAAGDATMLQQLGIQTGGEPTPEPPAPPTAPTVLGTGTAAAGGTAPPTQPQHQSMDDAMRDFFAEVSGQTQDAGRGF